MENKVTIMDYCPCSLKKVSALLFTFALLSSLLSLTGCGSGGYSLLQTNESGETSGSGTATTVKTSVVVRNNNLHAVGVAGTAAIPESVISVKMNIQDSSGNIVQSQTKDVLGDPEPLKFEFELSVGQVLRFFAYGLDAAGGTGNRIYEGQTAATNITTGMSPVVIELLQSGTTKAPALTNVTLVNSGSAATLSATVNPLGAGHVVASFKWGLTSAAGTPNISNDIVLTGTANVDVSHTIDSLLPGSEYFFDITAENNGQSITYSNTFFTPVFVTSEINFPQAPDVVSLSSLNVTGTSATLSADVIPNGAASILFFDWGTTATSLDHSSQVIKIQSNLWSASPHTVNYEATGLQSGTTYFFRVTVLNNESVAPTIVDTGSFTTN